MNEKPGRLEHEELFNMIEDALTCLEDSNEDKCNANQRIIGIRYLF